jgi:hypothetical protein
MVDLCEQDRVVLTVLAVEPGLVGLDDTWLDDIAEAGLLRALRELLEHAGIEIGRHDVAVRCDGAGDIQGEPTRTRADIRDPRTGPHSQCVDDLVRLPLSLEALIVDVDDVPLVEDEVAHGKRRDGKPEHRERHDDLHRPRHGSSMAIAAACARASSASHVS